MEPAASFAESYRLLSPSITAYCQSRLGTDGEDAAADAWLAAFLAFDRVAHDQVSIRRWMFTIARNVVRDRLRSRRRGAAALARLRRQPAPVGDVAETAATRLLAASLAFHRVTARERRLVALRAITGLSYAKIAARFGIKENTARMATERALKKLKPAPESFQERPQLPGSRPGV